MIVPSISQRGPSITTREAAPVAELGHPWPS
jgi:hypothetical protein